jgi:predicted NBD/HSP70 family sugar kinase
VTIATTVDLRQANLSRALRAVQTGGPLTRSDLTRDLGISRNTAAQVVGDLVAMGLLVETAARQSGRRGRPTTELSLGANLPATIVAEVTPEEVRIATVRLGRRIEDLRSVQRDGQSAEQSLHWIASEATSRVRDLGAASQGVGVSIYGLVDSLGTVRFAPNIGWSAVAVAERLRARLPEGTALFVGNDASMAALHEARYGAGRGARSVLYLYAADGVGGGLVVEDALVSGRGGFAGEVGHMLINPAGRTCRCGRRGCWETEVDQLALRRRGRPARTLSDDAAAAAVIAAAASGSSRAQQAVAETARWFGEGLGSLLNIFDPQVVVLGGLFSELWRAAGEVVTSTAVARCLTSPGDLASFVVMSADQRDASMLGTAEQMMQPLLARPGVLWFAGIGG